MGRRLRDSKSQRSSSPSSSTASLARRSTDLEHKAEPQTPENGILQPAVVKRGTDNSSHSTPQPPAFDLEDGEITEEAKISVQAPGTPNPTSHATSETVLEPLDLYPTDLPAEAHVPGTHLHEDGLEQTTLPPPSSGTPQAVTPRPRASPDVELDQTTELPQFSDPVPLSNDELNMSEAQLDYAKNLVLDLLGWGVEPEYLVECGVSSHAIYRIFTELRLRLPSNLSYFK